MHLVHSHGAGIEALRYVSERGVGVVCFHAGVVLLKSTNYEMLGRTANGLELYKALVLDLAASTTLFGYCRSCGGD